MRILRNRRLRFWLPVLCVLIGFAAWETVGGAAQRRDSARLSAVNGMGQQIYRAAMEYVQDKGHFPDANQWEDEITPYLPHGFSFVTPGNPPTRFAYNPRFSHKPLDFLSENNQTALFFESVSTEASPHDDFVSLAAGKNSSQEYFVLTGAGGGVYSYPRSYADLLNAPETRPQITGRKERFMPAKK